MGGETHEERGREVLVFARENGRRRIVWRMQLPAR